MCDGHEVILTVLHCALGPLLQVVEKGRSMSAAPSSTTVVNAGICGKDPTVLDEGVHASPSCSA